MFYNPKIVSAFIYTFFIAVAAHGQQVTNYNLVQLLQQNKLDTTSCGQEIQTFFNPKSQAITVKGILWLKGIDFKEGTIDVDLRGRNVFLQSFMGIAFHAKDTSAYDVVYFCPFRFHDTSDVTRKYSVKYMSIPDYDYARLRKLHPGVYENEVNPVPKADDWFHATIVVRGGWISVYVNHAATPSLKVKQLDTLPDGKIGLWSYASTLSSDFANLSITE